MYLACTISNNNKRTEICHTVTQDTFPPASYKLNDIHQAQNIMCSLCAHANRFSENDRKKSTELERERGAEGREREK